jgi:hypothetical protein
MWSTARTAVSRRPEGGQTDFVPAQSLIACRRNSTKSGANHRLWREEFRNQAHRKHADESADRHGMTQNDQTAGGCSVLAALSVLGVRCDSRRVSEQGGRIATIRSVGVIPRAEIPQVGRDLLCPTAGCYGEKGEIGPRLDWSLRWGMLRFSQGCLLESGAERGWRV